MIDLSPEVVAISMLGGILIGVLLGYHLGIVVGAIGLIVGYLVFGDRVGIILYNRMFDLLINYIILAVPLFIFMGLMLERSGIAEKMYDAFYIWLGGVRGGLAIITIIIGTIMAATVGIIAASTTMLGLIALPAMLKRGYAKDLASGSVCAGGVLGILIPPSVMLVIYAEMAAISVGKLFFAAFIPGFILSALYIVYITLRSHFQKGAAPPIPPEERTMPFGRKTVLLITSMFPPLLLILAVLGTIFLGVAAPTEAAAIGAFAATIIAAANRKLTWRIVNDTATQTLKVCGMIFIIATMSFAFVGVFLGADGDDVIQKAILAVPGGRWGAFLIVMIACFILGMFMDWLGIVFIMIPIISPIVPALGFDPLWFALMVCINLQMSFMSPPFAMAIYIVLGVAPKDLKLNTLDVIKGVLPFMGLIMIGLIFCAIWPELILWLPGKMIR